MSPLRFVRGLLPAFLSLTVPLAAQSSVWKVTRGGSTLYLGGTCHVLRPGDFPLPPEFDQAFAASARIVLETDLGRVQGPEMANIVNQHGLFAGGRTLRDALSPAAWSAVESYCAQSDLPVDKAQRMKPWFFVLMATVVEMQKLGLSLEGVDAHYFQRARAQGKPVGELETFERHVQFLLNLGEGHESEMIEQTLADLKEMPGDLSRLLEAWRAGDLAKLDATMLDDLRENYPAMYRELIVDRNTAWLPQLDAMLATPEIEFVLAGAGHMAGPDGLVARLRAKGCTVEQIVAR
jgi:hypothetical protein